MEGDFHLFNAISVIHPRVLVGLMVTQDWGTIWDESGHNGQHLHSQLAQRVFLVCRYDRAVSGLVNDYPGLFMD